MKTLILRKTTDSYNTYLSNCDLTNKYRLLSSQNIPVMDKIMLEVNLESLTSISNKNVTDSIIQMKGVFLLYILTGVIPYIDLKKIKTTGKSGGKSQNKISLRVNLENSDTINQFLFRFFVENWQSLLFQEFKLFVNHSKFLDRHFKNNNSFVFKTKLNFTNFTEVESFVTQFSPEVDLSQTDLNINFIFKNNKDLESSKNLIRNLPLFWISG